MLSTCRLEASSRGDVVRPPNALAGCLLDVSNSMRQAMESGEGDERAVDRLRAILRATLRLARAEQHQNPHALMFVGAFGMSNDTTPVVDLCALLDGLTDTSLGGSNFRSGHDRLVALANEQNVAHIEDYIRTKLSDNEARIIHIHLSRHTDRIPEFVNAIPTQSAMVLGGLAADIGKDLSGSVPFIGGWLKEKVNQREEEAVESSAAMKLARRICENWLQDFSDLVPRPVSHVVSLLERLQDHPSLTSGGGNSTTLLEQLKPYLYGWTPMTKALSKTLALFRNYAEIKQRALVLISDGESTDGDPTPLATSLKRENVIFASVFLTDRKDLAPRRLYDLKSRATIGNKGMLNLFDMASTVSVLQHPLPILAAVGWAVPSSGECALYTHVCSSEALEEFCSILLSARFGSTDALLDIVGKVDLDAIIDDEHVKTCRNPSDQERSGTCYAHAAAAVLHMALIRVHQREGGCPSIGEIRARILKEFPAGRGGASTFTVLTKAMEWYRPLRFRKVDEDGARQAVLHRRPVLTTFRLSRDGWYAFDDHFIDHTQRAMPLLLADMQEFQLNHEVGDEDDGGGHAVVLTRCDPRSLTFLNSWGKDWGSKGSFSIENAETLRISSVSEWTQMSFYDIYWYESHLTEKERRAYEAKVDEAIRSGVHRYPSLVSLEVRCPCCRRDAPMNNYTGSMRRAKCPLCSQFFKPQTENLVKALYAKEGLEDVA